MKRLSVAMLVLLAPACAAPQTANKLPTSRTTPEYAKSFREGIFCRKVNCDPAEFAEQDLRAEKWFYQSNLESRSEFYVVFEKATGKILWGEASIYSASISIADDPIRWESLDIPESFINEIILRTGQTELLTPKQVVELEREITTMGVTGHLCKDVTPIKVGNLTVWADQSAMLRRVVYVTTRSTCPY